MLGDTVTQSNQLTSLQGNETKTLYSPIIVAIDKTSLIEALQVAELLDPKKCSVKVGKELFTRCGPVVVHELHKMGFKVFLDLKFHDIPNTTAQAVLAAADLGVWMVNVHASSGLKAMQESKKRLINAGHDTLLIGVTVLTSSSQNDLEQIGIHRTVDEQVRRLALLTKESGLDGVVCSAQESAMLKNICGSAFKLITPGIRTIEDSADDQKRICTPQQAMQNGSDYLVIGRSITQAAHPSDKLSSILEAISQLNIKSVSERQL